MHVFFQKYLNTTQKYLSSLSSNNLHVGINNLLFAPIFRNQKLY